MATKSKLKSFTLLDFYRLFLGLAIFEGLLALWFLFKVPSETRNAFLASFSLQRVGMGFSLLLVLGVLIFSLYDSFRPQKLLKFLTSRLESILRVDAYHILIQSCLVILLISSLASILFYLFPDLQRLIFFLPNNYIFAVLGERAGFLIGWIFLISLKALILYSISGRRATGNLAVPVRLMLVSWILVVFIFLLFVAWSLVARKPSPESFMGVGIKLLILSIWFSFWAFINGRKEWAERFFHPFVCVSIGLCVFIVSLQFAQWFAVWVPRPDDQFILLASSFLHGKIYFITVPTYLHDLTFYNGHWFVAAPPFPIILISPFVAIWGVNGFNINTFSVVLEALAAVTMYLILTRLAQLGWIKLSRSGAIWLTGLFTFGTVYWWLSVLGTAGFFSQDVTILFCALAFLAALKKYSPWISGICLMAAVMSRPNVFVLWPALAAIVIQLNLKDGKVNWKVIFKWSVQSAIPVILGGGLLLYYNYLRFGNFFDFGYVTINGAGKIVQNVQKYGLFNLHFVPFNLRSMFLALPGLVSQCGYYLPRGDGMSMLMTTPASLYILRKFKISWWMGGCWVSILLSIVLLALYSNNGANQYGYRYLMDFIVPVIMIIAYNAGEKISGLLKTLIIASMIINYYGTISWFRSPC